MNSIHPSLPNLSALAARSMCRLIEHALQDRDGKRASSVQTSPPRQAPTGEATIRGYAKSNIRLPRRTSHGKGREWSACVAGGVVERKRSRTTYARGSSSNADRSLPMPSAWRSPPRVQRVKYDNAKLPSVSDRNGGSDRCCWERRPGRGAGSHGSFEASEPSSAFLAAALRLS